MHLKPTCGTFIEYELAIVEHWTEARQPPSNETMPPFAYSAKATSHETIVAHNLSGLRFQTSFKEV